MQRDLHPDMLALIDARTGLPETKSIEDERANWARYADALAQPAPANMRIHDLFINTPEHTVPVRCYRPAEAKSKSPAIVYLHGGGFMKGDLDSSDSIAWGYAELANATVFSVEYRLTPEHPYPAAFNDTYAVVEQLSMHANDYDVMPDRIAVAGDSAGGNLAAAACLAARDRAGPAIAAQVLVYPGTGLDQTAGSYIENADAFGLSTTNTIRYRDLYLPDNPHTTDPYARPVLAEDLSGLPPAWIHSAEIDPIRDDGRVYASQLALAGNEVHYREAKRMIHGFMRARFSGPTARSEFNLICDFLRAKLHHT